MKNFVQKGDSWTGYASANVAAGAGVRIGEMFGIAGHDALSGEILTLALEGVFELPKEANVGFSVGDKVYWDNSNGWCDATSSSQKEIGTAWEGANAVDATVKVRLMPTARNSVAS